MSCKAFASRAKRLRSKLSLEAHSSQLNPAPTAVKLPWTAVGKVLQFFAFYKSEVPLLLHLMIFKTSQTGYFRFSKRHKENFPWNQCTFCYQQISFSPVCKWVRLCHDTPSLLACPNLGPTYCFCLSTLNYRSGFFKCLQLNRLETKESVDLVQDMLMKLITLNSSLGHKTTFFFPTHRFYQHLHLLIQCNLFRSGTTNHLGEPDFTYQGRNQIASVCDHACRWAPQCLRVTRSWSLKQILHQHHWWRTEISKEPTHKEQRFF